jgi:nucleoside-diphosphate-sugar epimerase
LEDVSKSDSPILVTGAAGFIGAKTAELLLAEGQSVVGIDNLNDYYDVRLKHYRVNKLLGQAEKPHDQPTLSQSSAGLAKAKSADGQFHFYHLDIENRRSVDALFESHKFGSILNLAARAGVRYSMENPPCLHDHQRERHIKSIGGYAVQRDQKNGFGIHFISIRRAGNAVR